MALSRRKDLRKNKWLSAEIAILFVVAVCTMTICTRCSFIYPTNGWVDANCFFTVGKSMLAGKVPYRDLIEQKGPVLYMLHALAALISWDTFFGVYLLEVAAAFGFLWFSYQSMKLFLGRYALFAVVPVAYLSYTMKSFALGDSAEEFFMPLLAYLIWVGLKALLAGELPTGKEYFAVGVTAGLVFWVKFTNVGYYVGWYVPFFLLMVKDKRWKELLLSIRNVLLGVAAVSLPVLAYFAWNGALTDLFQVYFYNNLLNYTYANELGFTGMRLGLRYNVAQGIAEIHKGSAPAFWLFWAAVVWFGVRKKFLPAFYTFSIAAFAALGIYCTTVRFEYYSQGFACFIPLGVAAVAEAVVLVLRSRKGLCIAAGVCASLWFAAEYRNAPNLPWRYYKQEDLPQFQFAEIINQKEDATLLNYGFLDGGFYTVSGIVPNCPMFCQLNANPDLNREMQDGYLEEGMVDFVVTYDQILEKDNYRMIMESDLYRLYQKVQ